MSLYAALLRCNLLRPLDTALADSLRRLAPETPDSILAAAALASRALREGHVGLSLHALPWEFPDRALAPALQAAWQRELAASRWVSTPETPGHHSDPHTPLILEHGLIYLRRYREYERQLAAHLYRLGASPPDPPAPELTLLFERLFPEADDPQAQAALSALHHRLALITGGPGTGKTTTIARVLLLLIARAQIAGHALPRIALAAPTGQAAARMAASVRSAAQRWQREGIDPALCAVLPGKGQTLHRLLGSIPDSTRFTHHADNPIQADILVVDEVSMIDLPLMAKLVDALPDGIRLILLGDPDQLPSVEVGAVLEALVQASDSPILHRVHRVHLHRSYRQHDTLQLAPLADAVRQGERERTLHLLRSGALSNVHFHENTADPLALAPAALLTPWRTLAQAGTPAEALARIHELRILTVVRDGPQGALALNARIHALLAGPSARGQEHFHGQPIVITENSYRQGLFNGDLGICHRDARGVLMAWFIADDAATPRAFPLPALPAHQPAFATTVHKAQGAEFATVWLLLPERDNPVLTRELLYTALTRARRQLHLAASATSITSALSRHIRRCSRLAQRL